MEKRILSILTVLALLLTVLPAGVLADQSTTTMETAYKDISPNTEIYAVSDKPGMTYPYYGARWEPNGQVYMGRVANTQLLDSGSYGLINGAELDGESAFSFYYSLEDQWSFSYWQWVYGSLLDDRHAFLINLNFDEWSKSCRNVLSGKFDAKLRDAFAYLSELENPILMRIGGEMNAWDDMQPSLFIDAYRHIAQLARQFAPNVALVFSPNFSGRYGSDMDSFYPGDAYVDWVGVSLYYNRYAINGDTENDAFYGVNAYGDPMLNVQQVVNLSRLHRKPVVITEGGSIHWEKGEDLTGFAAERVQKAYSFLTMVYPEIKCIIYSDTDFNDPDRQYSLYKNQAVTNAYNSAVAANPTLVDSVQSENVSYYTRLSQYSFSRGTPLKLAAYTYANEHLTARWFLDGELQTATSAYPYACSIDTAGLEVGEHILQVAFSNGASKSYTFFLDADRPAQPTAWEPFNDVIGPDFAAYYSAILWAAGKSITDGTAPGVFSPDDSCTRGQAVTFLWRAMGAPMPKSTKNPFTDVAPGAYYYNAVLWAVEQGITTGMTETAFEPDSTVIRGQMVTFLHRMHGSPGASGGSFHDVPAGIYYENAVRWAVEKHITNGTGDNLFSPDADCTRAQIVTFLYRDQTQ